MIPLPFRFLTPFSFRSSRLLRNSLRSNILAGQLRRLLSKTEIRRLNLQRSLLPFPKALYHLENDNANITKKLDKKEFIFDIIKKTKVK